MKIISHRPDLGQDYYNPFKNRGVYPFNEIGRVLVDKDTGEIKARLSENNSLIDSDGNPITLTGNEDVMVYFPAFYCKRILSSTTIADEILVEKPVERYKQDFEVHPVFVRDDGSIRPYILYGAFKGSEVNGQLRSVSDQTPSHTKTISAFRDLARQGRDTRWNIETIQAVSMVQLLYKIAFQNLDSQSVIGDGWVKKHWLAFTGGTLGLGNRTGYIGNNGNQISLFGIEDFYGNIWSLVDGLLVQDNGYYITNSPTAFGNTGSYTHYPATPLMGGSANEGVAGYVKKIENLPSQGKYLNIAKELVGSATTQYCDYLYSHRRTQTNIAVFGGRWGFEDLAGAFCLYLDSVVSYSDSTVGCRLLILP